MDEYPGDTLGNRFLTFWGALGAIAAVALLIGAYRLIILPSNDASNDGGAGDLRLNTLATTRYSQEDEYSKTAEVEPGKTVRIPADAALPYAVKTLAAQKAAPSATLTPEATIRKQEEEAKKSHDPNVSAFEGK